MGQTRNRQKNGKKVNETVFRIKKARGAQGIAAEIPQARQRRAEELERKARFFAKQKMRAFC
jgi:hypothetical protein